MEELQESEKEKYEAYILKKRIEVITSKDKSRNEEHKEEGSKEGEAVNNSEGTSNSKKSQDERTPMSDMMNPTADDEPSNVYEPGNDESINEHK